MKRIKSIDLFAGCGGLMDGFEQSGHFDTVAAVEWEKPPAVIWKLDLEINGSIMMLIAECCDLIFNEQTNYFRDGMMIQSMVLR